jgi:PRTRC genetic system protein C
MLATTTLERIFIHKENGTEIRLTDPGEGFAPEAVMIFYSATYPILTNAKIIGPEIKDDEIQYRFESTMGVKG